MLEVRLFGQADVRCDGEPVKFAKRSATLAMLALLVLKRGQALSREALAFTLFPELDETTALSELRRYLYLTNKALPANNGIPWILSEPETVRWNDAAGAYVDVVEFERLANDSATKADAIDVYAGDLLENVYEDWAVAERERLRARYLGVLHELIERHRSERNYAAAIACAKRVLAADAWREDTLRTLMALRYESGDTAGALAEYDRFAKRLRDELAVTPMPETVAVRQSILRQDVLPGAIGAPGGAPETENVPRRTSPILPFVGRAKEMAQLYNTWSRAARGTAGCVFVAGEAGVGKTRLCSELARIVASEGGRVFVGTTATPESMPYQAIVEAVRSGLPLLLARRISPERRTVLAPLLPELRDPDVADVLFSETSPERETTRVYEALSFAVRALASPRPLLLVLEDLHWAGSATIEALGTVVRDLTRSPVLIVVTSRSEETPIAHPLRVLQRSLRAHVNVESFDLDRLEEADVGSLVERVEGLRERGNEFARALYAQSEGNALFLDEAIRAAFDGRDPAAAPETISDAIERRIERLGSESRTIAEIAAIVGSGCSIPVIRDVSNFSSTSIARALDELLDHRILREASARAGYDYVFSHHLIADAIYRQIEPALREQRHFRVAECLQAMFESNAPVSAREIARHYEGAGARDRAAACYLSAAKDAVAVHAHGDAIELAGKVLENTASDDLRRAGLELRETARSRRGEREGQREDIEALELLARDEPTARFDVVLRRVLLARALGESADEGRFVEQLLKIAEALDERTQAKALVQAATHAGLRSRSSEGVGPARTALAMYERCNDPQGQLECLYLLVEFESNIGDLEAANRYLEQMRERAGGVADRTFEARALAVAGVAALLRQQYRECFALTNRSLDLHKSLNDREGEASARGRLAVTAAWLGEYTLALDEFAAATKLYESLGHKRGLAISHANRTLLLMRMGLFNEALESAERATALFEKVQEARTLVTSQVNASFIHVQLGNAPKAKALAQSALQLAREMAYPVFEAAALANLGNAERLAGDLGTAIGHMEAGLAIRRSVQEPRDYVDDLADLTLAYLEAGRGDDAYVTARELREIGATSFDGAFWPQYAWWATAHGLKAGGAQVEAREAFQRARSVLDAFAARISDDGTREAFLRVPVNRKIAEDTP